MSDKKPKFRRQGAQFLYPETCGSSIRWCVQFSASGRRYADVELRDCNRAITWSGYGPEYRREMQVKLTIAIHQMQACLRAMEEMDRKHPQRRKKKRASD